MRNTCVFMYDEDELKRQSIIGSFASIATDAAWTANSDQYPLSYIENRAVLARARMPFVSWASAA